MIIKIITSDSLLTDSEVFRVEQSSGHQSLMKHDTPEVLNSTELFGALPMDIISNSPVASPDPLIIKTNSVAGESFTPNGFWRRWLNISGLNLPMTALLKRQRWKLYMQPEANGLTGTARITSDGENFLHINFISDGQ